MGKNISYVRKQVILGDTVEWVDQAKHQLEKVGATTILFLDYENWSNIRETLYKHFRDETIRIDHLSRRETQVLIANEKIRTSRVTKNPQGEPRLQSASSFNQEFEDSKFVRCGCCDSLLPTTMFGLRRSGGHLYCQSYCMDCARIYQQWRRAELDRKGIKQLSPPNHRNTARNQEFHSWYAEHILKGS